MKRTPTPLIILASLGALALSFWKYRPPTDEEIRARNERRRRDREISDRRNAQTRAELQRHGDRARLYEDPDIKAEWHRRAYDRFEPDSVGSSVHEEVTGRASFRGPTPVRLTDHLTGDQLEILDGDVADNFFSATVRAGSNGEPQRFRFSRGVDASTGNELVQVGRDVDDAGMTALARLFNSSSTKLPLGRKRPIILRRAKERYRGPGGPELLDRETQAYLDGHVDDWYERRGMDRDTGKKKPRGWEYR